MPRILRGNHLDKDTTHGAAPIDWDHPFKVHMIANVTNMTPLAIPAFPAFRPMIPITAFAAADNTSPVAINLLILLWSARNPLTNFPTAYAQYKHAPIRPNWVAFRKPLSIIGCFITFSDVLHT